MDRSENIDLGHNSVDEVYTDRLRIEQNLGSMSLNRLQGERQYWLSLLDLAETSIRKIDEVADSRGENLSTIERF